MMYDFAVIGGDLRQQYIEKILTEKGYHVVTYGWGGSKSAISLQEAMRAPVIISGIPFTRDQMTICALRTEEDMTLETMKDCLIPGQRFYAGSIPEDFINYCKRCQVFPYDFMKNENLTLYNTIATAEGAIAEALLHQPTNLHRSRCLILGYGKCAKVMAKKIRGMEASVTICARSEEDRSLADAFGYDTLAFLDWKEHLGEFEYVFNTVPQVILKEDSLSKMRRDAIIIDIASQPGGIDYEAANRLGIQTVKALGLPGKYAPKSSAESLVRCILQQEALRREEEESI